MPYIQKWVNPARLLRYKGVDVYCTYKDDDMENNPPSRHYYTLDKEYNEGNPETSRFDARKLSTWTGAPSDYFAIPSCAKRALKAAIDKGEIKKKTV